MKRFIALVLAAVIGGAAYAQEPAPQPQQEPAPQPQQPVYKYVVKVEGLQKHKSMVEKELKALGAKIVKVEKDEVIIEISKELTQDEVAKAVEKAKAKLVSLTKQ